MAKAKKLQENGVDIIPVTHESIVFDDNGLSIPEKYQTLDDAIHVEDFDGDIDAEIGGISKLQKVNVMSFGAKGDGVTDDTKAIQDAIDYAKENHINEVYFPIGKYNISDTIEVHSEITLTLYDNNNIKYNWETSEGTAVIYLLNNVNGFVLNSKSKIMGGVISTVQIKNYSSSCIKVDYSGDKSIVCVQINTTLRGRALSDDLHGTAIEVYSDNSGIGHLYNLFIDSVIESFDIGIHSHKNNEGNGNCWFSNLDVKGNITNCKCAIKDEFGGNGGRISASVQPLLKGNFNTIDEPLILLNAENILLDGFIWDLVSAINNKPIINYGCNIIISRYNLRDYIYDFSKMPNKLLIIDTSLNKEYNIPMSSKNVNDISFMNGNQDNLLLGGKNRYNVIESKENVVVGGGGGHLKPNGMWDANGADTYVALSDTTLPGTYTIEIDLGTARGVRCAGINFSVPAYSCKIELYSTKIESYYTIYDEIIEDKCVKSNGFSVNCYWAYNYTKDLSALGSYYDWNVNKIRYTIVLDPNSTYFGKINCNIASLYAYDGSINVLGYNGGDMYGDINFIKNNTGIVLTSPDGSKFRLKVDDNGNITSTKI